MTWVDHHHRDQALRAVLRVADHRRDGLMPWDEVPEAATVFTDTTGLLRALQIRWFTRLGGTIEADLADEPSDLERVVVHAWRRTAAEMPGLRAILDANRDHPDIALARSKEHAMLAQASGVASLGDPNAARLGAAIEERARTISVETTLCGAA